MKKIFFALAALVLAFTGCSQEEDAIQVSEKKAVKVVVNMDKPGFGEDTREARQGWEEGDEVYVMLNNDLGHLIALKYVENSWKEVVLFFNEATGQWAPIFSKPGQVNAAATYAYLASLPSSGDLKAIYCSSGISYFAPIPLGAITAAQLTGINIYSYAREEDKGECIMTCEDGEYSVSGGVLTLDITMVPQVAQFTIRDLDVEGDYPVGYTGTIDTYAGGKFTAGGVVLEPLGEPIDVHDAWVHDNEDGISIYASPWQVAPDGFDMKLLESQGGLGYFCFFLYDIADKGYYRDFSRKDYLENGDAVIFDGPTTTPDAEGWCTPIP